MADSTGSGTPVQLVIPQSVPGTTHTVGVPPARPGPPAAHLPFTGLDLLPLLLLAVLLVAVGAALLTSGRLPRTAFRRI